MESRAANLGGVEGMVRTGVTTVEKTREANVVGQTHFIVVLVTRSSNSIGEDVTKAEVAIPYRFLDFSDWGGVNLSQVCVRSLVR